MKSEKKKFLIQEMNWATAQIVLQGFSCIAIGGRLIRLMIFVLQYNQCIASSKGLIG